MAYIRCKRCGRKRRLKKKKFRIEKPCHPCIIGAWTPEEEAKFKKKAKTNVVK